jgi:hypothetical protein
MISHEVELDLTPPALSAKTGAVEEDEKGRKTVRVELKAKDIAGVENIIYRLHENHEYSVYTKPLTVEVNRPVTLEYKAVDRVGNESKSDYLLLNRLTGTPGVSH